MTDGDAQVLDGGRDVTGGCRVDGSRGERVGRVASEWFNRPDDERFLSLEALFASARAPSPEARAAARQAISAPIVARLFTLWQQTLPCIAGKSKLAEAIRSAIARRGIFERFLTDGLIEFASNIVGRAIRPQTIPRKNSLFAGSDGGGRTWATIAPLLQTCRMNDAGPAAWLTQTLEHIAKQGRAPKSTPSCPRTTGPE